MAFELATGDYLFEPHQGLHWDRCAPASYNEGYNTDATHIKYILVRTCISCHARAPLGRVHPCIL